MDGPFNNGGRAAEGTNGMSRTDVCGTQASGTHAFSRVSEFRFARCRMAPLRVVAYADAPLLSCALAASVGAPEDARPQQSISGPHYGATGEGLCGVGQTGMVRATTLSSYVLD